MKTRYSRMTETDVKSMIAELDRWALGKLGSKLTWEILEQSSGFSRQSLQAKPEIKAAYDHAKQALSGGIVKSKEKLLTSNEQLLCEIERLKAELEAYKKKEILWMERWQRIAFNIRQKGIQMYSMDKPINKAAKTKNISNTEAEKVLRLFDKRMSKSGRI